MFSSSTLISCRNISVYWSPKTFEHCSFTSRKLRLLLCIHLRVESSTTAKFIHLERRIVDAGMAESISIWVGQKATETGILSNPWFTEGFYFFGPFIWRSSHQQQHLERRLKKNSRCWLGGIHLNLGGSNIIKSFIFKRILYFRAIL